MTTDLNRNFTSFVLLDSLDFDFMALKKSLEDKLNITIADENFNEEGVIFYYKNILITLNLIKNRIPNDEAEYYANFNFMWKDALVQTKKHQAHLLVAVLSQDESKIEQAKLFTQIAALCLEDKHALGFYTGAVVLEPHFYIENAKMLNDNRLPVYNWVYVNVYPGENGVNAYTSGLRNFNKLELEVCDAKIKEKELFFCIYDIILHLLTYDLSLKDKDILKFEDGKKVKFIKSQGLKIEHESLKIIF
ncbi:DUF4261 domain-containing protein [Campylobacter hepaticus]|uniref:DUF4261 domain-containing protein n=1 Tax=Campylobacter hepaticus TaxID=1813019 RepID=A0A424Z1K9_9BACT|nr:DUF4261 domain-containing protein [Campylobacter hepaticus]AXP09316.1 DUF4261 domain-containing protein [Campylobacter hepaticus]MCZ0772939.1 DUF4261 domain-containing protein [Campylobacter hepaticus]MCZ0774408.1 DUF4261 domain-containing protein [Campylobacter hepaticus]MCZ0775660.1 DUF4261 domain-containing protein [Campylobacter hepaticus]MDX2323554.1 DUF4261 domain-containing protein [Campylobacter hepaticus]